MSINKKITEDFYRGISEANIEILESLLDDKFELIVPMSGGVLSGFYKSKKRFMEDILPLVFSCVNPDEIIFCKDFKIISAFDNTIISIAQNNGFALSGKPYNQTYLHIMTIASGKIIRLIESFDSALANDALWRDSQDLKPDIPFSLEEMKSNL